MAHAKRSSIGSQLPLPTTIALPDSPTTSSFPPSSPTTAAFGVQLPQGTTFTGTHPLPLNVSNIQLHNNQFPTHHSSTHAGGIQPSSSFFKPKRPGEYDQRYPALRTPDDLLEDEDEDEDAFKNTEKQGSGHLAIPHPLSPSFSTRTQSPSLSQHHHHHSNHSLEDLKQHEDRGLPPSDTEDVDPNRRTVNPKFSREPLIDSGNTGAGLVVTIPSTPSRIHPAPISTLSIGGNNNFNHPSTSRSKPVLTIGPASSAAPNPAGSGRFGLMRTVFGSNHSGGSPTPPLSASSRRDSQELPGKRTSLDMSINTRKTKRNSFVYKPRLTFESLRRSSLSKDDASRRESYVGTTEDESLNLPSSRHHPFSEVGIPLTPTKSATGKVKGHHHDRGRSDSGTPRKHRTRAKRMSFAASTNASSRSRSRSPSTSISVDDDSSIEDGGASTPTPGLFNPTPPPLARGEHPKMKTPLRHPLDPSLVPTDKLERELALRTKKMKRKRKAGLVDKVIGKAQHQPGLPTPGGSPPSSTHSPSKKNLRQIVNIEDKASDLEKESEGRLARRYELHPSRNRFYFGGRVMAGVWFGTTGVWWWQEAGRSQAAISLGEPYPAGLDIDLTRRPVVVGTEGRDWTWVTVDPNGRRAGKAIVIVCAYLSAVVISSMLVTAFTDPGILPRGLDLDPPYPANSPSDGGVRAPMPRDLKYTDRQERVIVRCATTASMVVTITANG
ncbi:hypothetical protein EST38_g3044 [Candolleomyces aberdarensis]|uniref:Uncharacterized protein n=1 Tax=Candolleomyces aberdarensis TaxID=2316362 RepID=A0A4Q2DQY6_9AGAR|nr:hypothetical protein EST38_g3044 [Candolleomyces aberdarensis]